MVKVNGYNFSSLISKNVVIYLLSHKLLICILIILLSTSGCVTNLKRKIKKGGKIVRKAIKRKGEKITVKTRGAGEKC
jgi:uncharacterized iron-regulated membrane protein